MKKRYVYLGSWGTAERYRDKLCNPVRRPDGKCIVGHGNQLVDFGDGVPVVVVRRRLRVVLDV